MFAGKMALWNKVVSGFDREEETVNFGVRTVAENNGSLYETSTRATIQSTGKVFNINFILIVKNVNKFKFNGCNYFYKRFQIIIKVFLLFFIYYLLI